MTLWSPGAGNAAFADRGRWQKEEWMIYRFIVFHLFIIFGGGWRLAGGREIIWWEGMKILTDLPCCSSTNTEQEVNHAIMHSLMIFLLKTHKPPIINNNNRLRSNREKNLVKSVIQSHWSTRLIRCFKHRKKAKQLDCEPLNVSLLLFYPPHMSVRMLSSRIAQPLKGNMTWHTIFCLCSVHQRLQGCIRV